MNPQLPHDASQNLIYPFPFPYNQGVPPTGGNQDYIPFTLFPLTDQNSFMSDPQSKDEKPAMPSYKEVKEELSGKLENKSRKEKRKLIKNKRNRMKRQMAQTRDISSQQSVIYYLYFILCNIVG